MAQTRNTIQKDIILNTIHNMRNHPTVEAVYDEIVKSHPSISKATVYRNLNQMAEQGAILRIPISNSADRYDYKTENHYHLRCKSCGRVFDIDIPYIAALNDIKVDDSDFTLDDHHLMFEGKCPDCNKK